MPKEKQPPRSTGYEAHALYTMWNKLSKAKLVIKDAYDLAVIDGAARDHAINSVSLVMLKIDTRLREIEQEQRHAS